MASPFSAFANAISKVSGDYADDMVAKRLRAEQDARQLAAEDRAEKRQIAQEGRVLKNQTALLRAQAEIATDAKINELKRLSPVQAEQAIRAAYFAIGGTDAYDLPKERLWAVYNERKKDVAFQDLVDANINQVKLLIDPSTAKLAAAKNEAEWVANLPQAQAAYSVYSGLQSRLDALRKTDPSVNVPTPNDLALNTVASELQVLQNPKARRAEKDAVLAQFGFGKNVNPEQAVRSITANPSYFAQMKGVTPEMLLAQAKLALTQSKMDASGPALEMRSIYEQMTNLQPTLVKLGIDPAKPFSEQRFAASGAAIAPKPASDSAPGTNVVPAGAAVAPAPVPTSYWNTPNEWNSDVVSGPQSVANDLPKPSAPSPFFAYSPSAALSGQQVMDRRREAVADAVVAGVQGVGNYFRPSSWNTSSPKAAIAAYEGPAPELEFAQLQKRLSFMADQNSPAAVEIKNRLAQLSMPSSGGFFARQPM